MRIPTINRSSRVLVAPILVSAVSALCAVPPASAEIYKCVAKNGGALYQNFPCQFDSNPLGVKTLALAANAPQASHQPVPVTVNRVAAAAKPVDLNEPRAGMLSDEVRALLGEPMEIVPDQPDEGEEIWRYVNKRIQFDRWHRVSDVKSWE